MNKNISLQKFTDLESKFNVILSKKQISKEEVNELNQADQKEFYDYLNDKILSLNKEEKDAFIQKTELLMTEYSKNVMWENNHATILQTITEIIKESGIMPSPTYIATKCNLSRQTIYKHLQFYSTNQLYFDQKEQFKFMGQKLLSIVLQSAMKGDIGAAKLYFNIVGNMDIIQGSNNTMINNQNNFIQINGTVLNQETIKGLNSDQLNTIESILKTATSINIENQ